jgi:RimJ/RimL family protein N-acetyltransferase
VYIQPIVAYIKIMSTIEFESVYRNSENILILFELIKERTEWQSISHTKMPEWTEHKEFVMSYPYHLWNIIKCNSNSVGSIYLTYEREIGISIFSNYKGEGYGESAIRLLMSICPGEFLANINPDNTPSIKLFEKLGGKKIQVTYKL